MQKIKRKGVLLSLIAAVALCFGVRKVDAEADAPPLTSANFTALCGDLAGATTLEELIPAAKSGTAVDGFYKRDQVTLSFGGKEWTAVYLSESERGDILLTLWLSSAEETPPLNWSACRERNPSPDSDFPSNLYSFSFIRSYLCGTPYKDPTEQITSNSAQDKTWADFLRDFGDYLAAPEEVPYQETQSARALFEKPFDLLNESYGDQSLEYNYSTKEGYTDWKEDKLFLPSVSEIGESPNTGIWKTSEAQRTTDENNFYWLRSAEVKEERSRSYSLEAYYVSGAESICNSVDGNSIALGVRPAIHLNLTKVAPTESPPDLPDKPEGSMLRAEKEYDGTPLTLSIAYADLLSVSSMTDGASFTLSKDGTGTFSAVNAGTYELAVLPKDGTWSDGTNEPAVYTLFISRAQKTLTAKWTVCDEAGENDEKFLFTGKEAYSAHAIYNGKSLNEIPAECIQASLFDQAGTLHEELSFTLARKGGENIGEEMRISLELENTDKNVEWTVSEASKRFSVDMIKRPVSIKLKTGLDSVYGEPLLRPETCFEYAEGSLKILENDGDVLALTGIEERANAGEYEVQLALQAAYAERYELTCEGGRYTVLRRKCDTGAVFALEKEYDGTTEAALDVSQLSLTGTVEGDDVNIHANGIFDEKNAGDRTVFVTLSLSGKDSDNYLLERYEYSLRARILPREITVEIGDASSIYGDATPEFSYRLAGGTVIAGDELLFEFSLDREAKSAGRYEISAVCGNPNYAVTFINGTYTIYKAQIEIPIIEDLIYNGEMQKVKVDEAIYIIEGSAKDVGEYEAVLRLKDSTNYEFTTGETEVIVKYKILPYAVTVRIDDASSVYGKPIAELGYTLMSPIFGDDDLGISLHMDGMNAGTYAITGIWTNRNYQVTFINGTYTIYKARVEIPLIEDLVYNGEEQKVVVDESIYIVEGSAKDVGEYEAVLRLKDSANYEFKTGEAEVKVQYKILPYSVIVRINDASSSYGKPIAELGFTVLDKLFGDDELGVSLRMDGVNAGTYAITGTWTNRNYQVTFINGTYTIHKAQIEIPTVEDLIYNGEEQKVKVDETIFSVEGSAKGVGEYEAILKLKDSTNYEFETGEETIKIKYKILPYAVTVRINDASSVYGEPIAKLSYSLSNELFGDDDLGISLQMDGMNAGTYLITGKWKNHNYQVTFINGIYTIYKAQVEIPTIEDLIYNGEMQKVVVDESIYTVEGSAKDVGTYEAVLKLKDSTNYEFETGEAEVKVQYKILPYAVTVRIDDASSVYGAPIAKLGYTLLGKLFGDDDLGISLRMEGVNAGIYAITGTWTNRNYQVTFINGIYTIYKAKVEIPKVEDLVYNGTEQSVKVNETIFTVVGRAKDVGTYEAVLKLKDSTNYEFESGEEEVRIQYKILPYAVTVRINDASSVYNEPIAKLGYTVLGTLFGDDDLGISLRMEGVNAGTYPITGKWTNHNYTVTFINGSYTIHKAQIEIPSVKDLIYNGKEQFINVDETFFSVEGSAKNVGEYEAVLRLKDSTNYEFTSGEAEVKVKYKILPYAVTVRIDDTSSVYGEPIAKLGYTLLGKLFGDDDLGISLRMEGMNAGTYPITGKWTNHNYTVTFINGTYTIYKAQKEIPSVKDLIYNGKEQFINVDETFFSVEGSAKNVGEYEAVLKLKDSTNYEFETGEAEVKVQYKILPYAVTVRIDDASSVYGAPIAKLDYTLLGELFGDDELGISLRMDDVNAGTYAITGIWANQNYDVTFINGTYTIYKAQIEIPSVEDLIYNGAEQKIAVDESIYIIEGCAKDVGEYNAILKLKDSENYEFTTGEETIKIKYKILPYAVTVGIKDASSSYGEPIAKLTYTLSNELFGNDDLGLFLYVKGMNAGTYKIEGTWKNKNYVVTFEGGIYTILKAKIDIPTVEDLVYNGEAQKVKVDETIYTVEGRAKDVGEHEAIIKIKDSVNYEFETGAAEVKIKYKILPYSVTVQIENASSVYGEPIAKINYTLLSPIFGDDDLGIELTVNGVNAGTHAIEGTWANQNYIVTFISGSYTIHKAQNNWADGFDLKSWLQSGDFTHLPSTKFGEVQIEIFLDESCTKKFEGDIQNAPPGRYFLHFFVPQSENFEGFDEVVPFLVKFTDLLSDESSNAEPPYSDRANFPHFELILSAGALSLLLAAVYAAKARRNHHQDDENQDETQ